jgi:hypothetical protein
LKKNQYLGLKKCGLELKILNLYPFFSFLDHYAPLKRTRLKIKLDVTNRTETFFSEFLENRIISIKKKKMLQSFITYLPTILILLGLCLFLLPYIAALYILFIYCNLLVTSTGRKLLR